MSALLDFFNMSHVKNFYAEGSDEMLKKFWDSWTFDPKKEIPKKMLKLVNKKIFY